MSDGITLNKYQQAAVDFPHDRAAVVTAAAGSGKTTLLVKRVIRLLSDPKLGIGADEIAIMTFTRNATKSMRDKLNAAIMKELAALSDKTSAEDRERYEHLKRQLLSLRRAYISTIDAFSLRIIRENSESFELPVNLTVADGAKKAAMQSQALKAALRDFYGESFSDEERDRLFYSFSFEDDDELTRALLSAAEALSTFPDAERWTEEAESVYENPSAMEKHFLPLLDNFLELNVGRIMSRVKKYEDENILGSFRDELDGLIEKKPTDALKKTRDEIFPMTEARIKSETALSEQLLKDYEIYKNKRSLSSLCALVNNLRQNAENLPAKPDGRRGSKLAVRKRFNELTDEIAKSAERLAEFCGGVSDEEKAVSETRGVLNTFFRLLRTYMNYYKLEKETSGCVDFSDCERELYKKLSENGGDNDFKRALSERFKCVIVDEFQDSNKIQAEIFRYIGQGRQFYVGDVKQSIYAFRGADPYIMAQLCDDRSKGFEKLPLNMNYRSRAAVIDTVNAAFSGLMTKEYGGTDYSDGNGLNLGSDLPEPAFPELYDSEICFVKNDRQELAENEADADMTLPRYTARKIKELCEDANFLVADGRDGNGEYILRRARYSDFMILLRSKTKLECYRKALGELNITSVAPKGKSFFEADEVKLACNYLKIVDDPLLDEEMLKVMMSPVYRFTAEETARIKMGIAGIGDMSEEELREISRSYRELSLYTCLSDCMKQSARRGRETVAVKREVSPEIKRFYNDLKSFRYFMSANSLSELVRRIYEETDLVCVVAAFEDSEGRVENIRQLQRLAADFEARGGGELGDFLRFIDRAQENSSSGIEEASRPTGAENSVSIMTFHGSKGLEAPVCIMTELQSAMNASDYSGNFLLNADKYTAIKHTDIKKRKKTKTLAYTALSRFIRERQLGEELRLLYVAMTRAKEKLIMVSSIGKTSFDNFGEYLESAACPERWAEIYENASPFKCVFGSLMRETPVQKDDLSFALEKARCKISAELPPVGEPECESADVSAFKPSESGAAKIRELLKQSYKHAEDVLQQAKFTATELAHKKDVKPISLTKPDFYAKADVSGAEKGNAYHHCMQYFPLEKICGVSSENMAAEVGEIVETLEKSRRITAREREIINCERLVSFFSGELGRRVLKAFSENPDNVRREQPFFAEVKGSEVRQEYEGSVSVQGQIDAYFIENGEIVVLDYKSDTLRNLEKELESYKFQVEIYTKILKKLTGMNVKETYLYSFLADKEIKL